MPCFRNSVWHQLNLFLCEKNNWKGWWWTFLASTQAGLAFFAKLKPPLKISRCWSTTECSWSTIKTHLYDNSPTILKLFSSVVESVFLVFVLNLMKFAVWHPLGDYNAKNHMALRRIHGGRSNLVMVQPSCQPYLESRAHKLLGGSGGMPPRKFLKMPKYAIFSTFSLLAWKIYCTLHSRYKQHKMSVYKMTWLEKQKKIFFLQLMVQPKSDKLDRFRWPCWVIIAFSSLWIYS